MNFFKSLLVFYVLLILFALVFSIAMGYPVTGFAMLFFGIYLILPILFELYQLEKSNEEITKINNAIDRIKDS